MKSSVWQRLDVIARNLTPLLIAFCLVVVSVAPLRLPGASYLMPSLALMAIYYWGLHRPDLLPAPAAFLIGLLQDILSGGPLGVHTLIFLGVFGICVSQQRFFYGKSFLVVWWAFMTVAAAAMALEWVLNSVIAETMIAARPAYFKCLTTIAVYPVIAWIFARIQRTLPSVD